jgi:hypothetical protein
MSACPASSLPLLRGRSMNSLAIQGRDQQMSVRTRSDGILLFSAFLLTFAPLLRAEAQDVDVQGNLTMHDSTDATTGNVLKEGVPFIHNFGVSNTFLGSGAGNFTMTGFGNTASGRSALAFNTIGNVNTATGTSSSHDDGRPRRSRSLVPSAHSLLNGEVGQP